MKPFNNNKQLIVNVFFTLPLVFSVGINAKPNKESAPAVKIDAVIVNDDETLTIYGTGFVDVDGQYPAVTLANTPLSVLVEDSEPVRMIVDTMTIFLSGDGLVEGDFRLTVIQGDQQDSYDLTFGAVGPEGPEGIAGAQGTKGDTGDAGPEGPQGIAGTQGTKGDTGVAGSEGPQGIAGAQGTKGDTGDTGPEGPQGFTDLTFRSTCETNEVAIYSRPDELGCAQLEPNRDDFDCGSGSNPDGIYYGAPFLLTRDGQAVCSSLAYDCKVATFAVFPSWHEDSSNEAEPIVTVEGEELCYERPL